MRCYILVTSWIFGESPRYSPSESWLDAGNEVSRTLKIWLALSREQGSRVRKLLYSERGTWSDQRCLEDRLRVQISVRRCLYVQNILIGNLVRKDALQTRHSEDLESFLLVKNICIP